MTLNDLIESLQKLAAEGHGVLPVAYRHGASGDSGDVGGAHVTNRQDECGPFDLDAPGWSEGDSYVSLYVGN